MGEPEEETHQYSLFELFSNEEDKQEDKKTPKCKIYDWRADKSILFETMKKQGG
ncbi:MAG: hypothetical protein NC337_00895 [Roseburia sp.]|nr:hypothetical protein [Roseburia sp.]